MTPDRWGSGEHLPEELGALLAPGSELGEDVLFFEQIPQPILFGRVALPFAALFFILAAAIGPIRLLMGVEMDSGGVLGTLGLAALLTLPGVLLVWRWKVSIADAYERSRGGWRRGVFIKSDWLLFNLGAKHVIAVRKDQISRVTFEPESEGAPRPHLAVHYALEDGETRAITLREEVEPAAEELFAAIRRWRGV